MKHYHITLVCCVLLLSACGQVVQLSSQLNAAEHIHPQARSIDRRLVYTPPHLRLRLYKAPQQRHQHQPRATIILAASGGGYRAANLTAGVLMGLEKIKLKQTNDNLLNHIDYFSTVSGGGFAVGLYLADKFARPSGAYSWQQRLLHGKACLRQRLRRNYADDLFFGLKRTLRLEQHLGKTLLQTRAPRQLQLGDVFVDRKAKAAVTLPMWITNTTNINNVQLVQFTPDVLQRYQIANYIHNGWRFPLRQGFEHSIPLAVGMTASATFPYAVAGSSFATRACRKPCYLHLFDGGIVDNLGLLTVLDILQQDKTPVKIVIFVDAYHEPLEPFRSYERAPRQVMLLKHMLKASADGFQRNMAQYAQELSHAIAMDNGSEKVVVLHLDLQKYPRARQIGTQLWITEKQQSELFSIGQKLVAQHKTLLQQLAWRYF